MTDVIDSATELDLLKKRADAMGISYHPAIGVVKLKEKLDAVLAPKAKEEVKAPQVETIAQRNARLRKEANKLVRLRLTCMNPAKKAWPGEMFSVGNSAIGWIKKYVPFAAEDGWHIPAAIVEVLRERKYTQFYMVQLGQQKIKKSRLVREFAIEVLPPLTTEELKELATRQKAEKALD